MAAGSEQSGPGATAPGQQLRALFYALPPGESSFRSLEEVPDYVEKCKYLDSQLLLNPDRCQLFSDMADKLYFALDKSIPFFITFIGLEFAVSWIQKRKLSGRINDGISSLSLGILSRLPE
ncbi:hypothetical protein BTVI_70844 [Pitangus sulphuratus]|nr:hypothetical protein BTVI_70844 [Pitangus sulphuratus]